MNIFYLVSFLKPLFLTNMTSQRNKHLEDLLVCLAKSKRRSVSDAFPLWGRTSLQLWVIINICCVIGKCQNTVNITLSEPYQPWHIRRIPNKASKFPLGRPFETKNISSIWLVLCNPGFWPTPPPRKKRTTLNILNMSAHCTRASHKIITIFDPSSGTAFHC